MERRDFIKKSLVVGASSFVGSTVLSRISGKTRIPVLQEEAIDLAVVKGADYFSSTIKAVERLGGMGTFVTKGARVGLLINSPWRNPGTYTNPDVALAVVKMCYDAGAKEIYSVEGTSGAYWRRSSLADQFAEEIGSLRPSGGKDVKVEIPKGKKLKQADVSRALMECDVVINIPIAKDHEGTHFTCTLKNMMGASPYSTNRFFHYGSGAKGGYDDVPHLSQCIADINLVRKPDLFVVDTTEFVTTNGPGGPGEMKKPQKIVAGTDGVAVDAYCAEVRGLKSQDVLMITMAHEHGLGEMDFSKLTVKEVDV
jgi:uncharacterized protein (DUF362 family)